MLISQIFHIFNCEILYLILLAIFLRCPKFAHSWDLAVASDAGLNLLTLDRGIEMSLNVSLGEDIPADLYALTYDPSRSRFFFSVNDNRSNYSIFEFHLETREIKPLIEKGQFEVQGLAYDTSLKTLYWTDGNGHTVRKMDMDSPGSKPQNISSYPDQVPMGIAVTYCHRAIFWANNNHTSASLDRTEFDGSNHMQIVVKDIFQPLGVAIDEVYGKVYWTDDRPGIYYSIERCSLDGSSRELIMYRTNQEPFGLAILSSTILWSDASGKNIWSLSVDMTFPNHTMARLEPGLVSRFTGEKPYGVAAYRNSSVVCEPIKELRRIIETPVEQELGSSHNPRTTTVLPTERSTSSYSDRTTLKDEINEFLPVNLEPSSTPVPDFCLNDGELLGHSCRCKRGFSGFRCEIPICYQHCLHGGTCYPDHHGYPDCQCLPGYEGRRCERDVCDEYCLGGGRCYVESGQPSCQCPPGTSGQRCEVMASMLAVSTDASDIPLLGGLAAVACALLVAVGILSWRVCVLKRRPRVKKRYIVNKRFRSISGPTTAMTSRPPSSPAVEQCEITIENCCNMNICETPCFEPNVRTSKSEKKAEDRRNLLGNMEEPGGSD